MIAALFDSLTAKACQGLAWYLKSYQLSYSELVVISDNFVKNVDTSNCLIFYCTKDLNFHIFTQKFQNLKIFFIYIINSDSFRKKNITYVWE